MTINLKRLPPRHWLLAALGIFYTMLWAGGIATHILFGRTLPGSGWAAPAFLFAAGALVLAGSWDDWRQLALAAAIGFAAEVMGVRTAVPFGPYRYTAVLAPNVFGVPLAVACAWLVLSAYLRQMRMPLRLAAVWMAAIDLLIEPLAANTLDYWHWSGRSLWYGAPYTNFIGWYLVSVVIFYATRRSVPRNATVVAVGLSIQLFFTTLAVVHQLYLPAAIGIALTAAGAARWMSLAPQEPISLNLTAQPRATAN